MIIYARKTTRSVESHQQRKCRRMSRQFLYMHGDSYPQKLRNMKIIGTPCGRKISRSKLLAVSKHLPRLLSERNDISTMHVRCRHRRRHC